jgi:hypothetical protein
MIGLAEARHGNLAQNGTDEGLPAAIAASFPFKQREDEQELLALVRHIRRHPLDTAGFTLERAAILKFLCDAYLIRRFETMAQET